MITDEDLAEAIAGRENWQPTAEDTAEYRVPGSETIVRVGRIRNPPREGPRRHDRYFAAEIREGRALHSASFGFALEAVRAAERVRPS